MIFAMQNTENMETLNIILPIITGLLGGGATWLFTIKYTRRQAEADAMEKFQAVYQGLINDLFDDRSKLREERNALSESYQALTKKVYELENVRIKQLEETVRSNSRILEQLAKYAKAQSQKCKDCVLIELISNSQL